MSPRREVFVRNLALLQRKTLIKTKNRTLKCLRRQYSTVRSMKNVAVLTEAGHLPSFFVPTPGDLTAQESPPSGICHPRPKKMQMPGGQHGSGGRGGRELVAAGIDWCIMSARIEYCRKNLVANCFGNFGKKKLNELSEMYRRNGKYSKNNKFNKDCKL